MTKTAGLAAAGLLLLFGSAPAAAAAAPECAHRGPHIHAQGVKARVEFIGVQLNGSEHRGHRFSSARLSDLRILVHWRHLFLNHHRQRLDIHAPDGALYQSLTRLLTARDVDAPVETVLPVNGTWITRYGLYGTWCVEVFLDDEDQPVTHARLVIKPSR